MDKQILTTWPHYCMMEHSSMKIGKGETCNWCGATEHPVCDDHQFPVPNESEITLHRRISND